MKVFLKSIKSVPLRVYTKPAFRRIAPLWVSGIRRHRIQMERRTSRRAGVFSASADASSSASSPSAVGQKVDVREKPFALVSVSDKTGLEVLAQGLSSLGYALTSTGGTASALESYSIDVTKVETLTDFPEMLDGRVKTLHPSIHGGILAKRDQPSHVEALHQSQIPFVDVVVVNLYPFEQTVIDGCSFEIGVENIDIGGAAMIRAAAKNHEHVYVIVDPSDYTPLLEILKSDETDAKLNFRKRLAWKAFQHCASYDALVAEWMWTQLGEEALPEAMTVPLHRQQLLRYGENPHQKAAFYSDRSLEKYNVGGIATAIQHHGKEMSYNNYLDADAAYSCVCEFKDPSCVVVKHTNPCGAATRGDLSEAYGLALMSDPVSSFGGIVAFNREVDEKLAMDIRHIRSPTDNETKTFFEIVVAPSYTPTGLEILKEKSKNLRILEAKPKTQPVGCLRQVSGGFLYQEEDALTGKEITFTCVSEKQPTEAQLKDLQFAWTCVKHVKSNAITISKDGRLLGMGSGQPNRVKSVEIAMEKAGDEIKGAVLASDAFFPFSWGDAVETACKSGVVGIVHPGGSIRDGDAVDCCNQYGVVLLTTGIRHFKH